MYELSELVLASNSKLVFCLTFSLVLHIHYVECNVPVYAYNEIIIILTQAALSACKNNTCMSINKHSVTLNSLFFEMVI